MLPLAKASIGLIGTISRRTLERGGAAAALAFRPSTEIVKPVPGSHEVSNDQTDRNCNSRRNCEEENCFNSDLADFAGITQAG